MFLTVSAKRLLVEELRDELYRFLYTKVPRKRIVIIAYKDLIAYGSLLRHVKPLIIVEEPVRLKVLALLSAYASRAL